jgi:hypothetical protein
MSQFHTYQLEDFDEEGKESMGSKARDWYRATPEVPDLVEGQLWLFKVPERFHGEIWSEKVAAEIGSHMNLPTARVELAQLGEHDGALHGTICLSFADGREGKSLEHGNELMEEQAKRHVYSWDEEEQVGLDAVYDYLQEHQVGAPIGAEMAEKSACFYFTGYLVFDALIGNVDRHHQNWGVVRTAQGALHLAPTFDHGACLGRELSDKKRQNYLDNKQISNYADNRKGRAKIAPPGDFDRTAPFRLLDFLPDLGQDQALCFWLERALKIDATTVSSLFARLPDGMASSTTLKFAHAFTDFTRSQLAELREDIC